MIVMFLFPPVRAEPQQCPYDQNRQGQFDDDQDGENGCFHLGQG